MVQTTSFEARETPSRLHRFVRTDFYIDPTVLPKTEAVPWVYNLSAVWSNDQDTIAALTENYNAIFYALMPEELRRGPHELRVPPFVTLNNTIGCLAALLNGNQVTPGQLTENARTYIDARTDSLEHSLATELMAQSVVIERSPPIAQALSSFLHGATSVSLGSLIGMSMTDNPYLMMITVPAGIIIMGTAFGVSRGLQIGLQKRVEKLVNPPKKRR